MELNFNVFSIVLIFSGLINLFLSFYVFRISNRVATSCGTIMLAVSVWAIAYGLELASNTLSEMLFWISFEYLGIAFLPALWIIFTFNFAGRERWLTTKTYILLFLEPIITLTLVVTNRFHQLHYGSVSVNADRHFPILEFDAGIWYYVHMTYFYSLLIGGVILLLQKFRSADELFRQQNRLIVIGALVPWIFNILYLSGIRPFGLLDITPFAFIVSAIIIGVGLLKYRLFNIIPVAREAVIDAIQEGVLVTDVNDCAVDVNPAMRKILSAFSSDPIGEELGKLLPDFNFVDSAAVKNNGRIELQLTLQSKYYSVTVTPLFDKSQRYSGKIFLFKDVSESKAYEEHLDSLNKLKDKLFSIIAHDLRSPMVNLLDLLSMTRDGMLTDAELREFLPQLEKNVRYTSSLLENLLQWSKSQLEGSVMNPVDVNIHALTSTMVNDFEGRAAEKGIIIENQIGESLRVFGDQDMIQAVYRNLLSNAIKFCRKGDTITVSGDMTHNMTTICIKDTGIGISEADAKKLFSIGTFTKRGTSNEQGTGLGLLLAKDFVEKNSGKIWVESILGEGSSFCFSLPIKN